MRIAINLAREPFRRDRPLYISAAVGAGLLLCTLSFLLYLGWVRQGERDAAQVRLAKLKIELARHQRDQQQLQLVAQRPENAEVLEKSVFFNTLLRRKGVSWTKIFGDLEGVMPHDVRLISVRPQLTPQNGLYLDMVVGAQGPEPVTGFLIKLEGARQFGPTTVSSVLPPSQTEPLYRYRISVTYAQEL